MAKRVISDPAKSKTTEPEKKAPTEDNNPSKFGMLNRIYSSDLSLTLKHHFASRLFCLHYGARAAAILLYDASDEKLKCKANYFHRDSFIYTNSFASYDEESLEKRHIIRYISFYHFLHYYFLPGGIPKEATLATKDTSRIFRAFLKRRYVHYNKLNNYVEIIDSGGFKKLEFSEVAEIDRFVKLCIRITWKHAVKNDGTRNTEAFYYKYYREIAKNEEYDIGTAQEFREGKKAASYAGYIFDTMLTHKFSEMDDLKIFYQEELEKAVGDSHNLFTVHLGDNLAKIGLKFVQDPYYVGIPLMSNGRCIGLLRLLYFKKDEAIKKILIEKTEVSQRSLLYSIEILGSLIAQSYFTSYLESIPRDYTWVQNDEQKNFADWCDRMQKAMNCHGVMLRLRISQAGAAVRKGYSQSIKSFAETLERERDTIKFIIDGTLFHSSLTKLFPDINRRDPAILLQHEIPNDQSKYQKKIVAVTIDFGTKYTDAKVLHYYYVIGYSEEVHRVSDISHLNSDKLEPLRIFGNLSEPGLIEEKYHKLYTGNSIDNKHKGRYMLIIDMPSKDVSGVATFSNSGYRKFNLADVRFAYSQVKRLSLSLSVKFHAVFNRGFAAAGHEITNLTLTLGQLRKQFEAGSAVPPDEYFEKLHNILHEYSTELIQYSSQPESYVKNHQEDAVKPYPLKELVKKEVETYNFLVKSEKGCCIDLEFIPNNESINWDCIVNELSIRRAISGLLMNAKKYCHTAEEMLTASTKKVKGFKQETHRVQGNIGVRIIQENEMVTVEISNQGDKFNADPKLYGTLEYILDEEVRISGRGFGLFLVRQKLELIEAVWHLPKHDEQNNRNTFSFTFEKRTNQI